jgi:hypothetical protein
MKLAAQIILLTIFVMGISQMFNYGVRLMAESHVKGNTPALRYELTSDQAQEAARCLGV